MLHFPKGAPTDMLTHEFAARPALIRRAIYQHQTWIEERLDVPLAEAVILICDISLVDAAIPQLLGNLDFCGSNENATRLFREVVQSVEVPPSSGPLLQVDAVSRLVDIEEVLGGGESRQARAFRWDDGLAAFKVLGIASPLISLAVHEFDLKAFAKNLLDSVGDREPSSIRGKGTVTLRTILCGNRISSDIKLNVMRALISRNIAVPSNSDGTVGGLLIDRAGYQQIVADARSSAAGNTKNPVEVARWLSCSRDAIPGLVKLCALQARVTPIGLSVSDESIAAFSREYISLSSFARVEQTSSRALMRRCQDRGIWMLLVPMPRQGPQPFIRKTDHVKLRST